MNAKQLSWTVAILLLLLGVLLYDNIRLRDDLDAQMQVSVNSSADDTKTLEEEIVRLQLQLVKCRKEKNSSN